MAGVEETIDKCVKCVEGAFGACKLNGHSCANCAARCSETGGGRVQLDQLRPMQHPELTGAVAEEQATGTEFD
eukprot:97241-Pyramimonas_sp.AAC.1